MLVASVLLITSTARAATEDPYARAVRLVAQMTLTEKLQFVQQNRSVPHTAGYTGVIAGVPRLGIPELRMNDGPEGFRGPPGTSTQWPSGLTVAHSFDPELLGEWGVALGVEFSGKGANCQFGPGSNLARIPNGGRSFEYLAGEDPFLGYTLIQPIVKGIQSQGVVANAKHFIGNGQEGDPNAHNPPGMTGNPGDRHTSSMIIDERTMMEMYWPTFEGAVDAGVLSIMCANNQVNGVYVCENNVTGNALLREHGGFKGWMCSDYDGTRSTIDAANNGLDIAMPGPDDGGAAMTGESFREVKVGGRPDYFGAPLREAIKNGDVSEATITLKAVRVVYSLAAVGALDFNNTNTSDRDVTSDAHRALARKLASHSATLLQNKHSILPLDLATLKKAAAGSVALFGVAAQGSKAIYGGGGSGSVTPKNPVSIGAALLSRLGQTPPASNATCNVSAVGVDYFGSKSEQIAPQTNAASCGHACASSASLLYFTFETSTSRCWCHLDVTRKVKKPGFDSGSCTSTPLPPGEKGPLIWNDGTNIASAVAAAKAAKIAIVVIAQTSHEGLDRKTLHLDQSDLVTAIAAVQPNTVVITITPGPFVTPWRDAVAAIIDFGFAGEQEGAAVADVLFGDVNPMGKMPHTLPNKENEMMMTQRQYPGEAPTPTKDIPECSATPTPSTADGHNPSGGTGAAPCSPWAAHYDEKLEVGYRWYDAHQVTPAFAFGHGLSYTTFAFSDVKATKSEVTVTVTNSGNLPGAEVAQLYMGFPSAAGEPPQQLKGFKKTKILAKGEATTITFLLNNRSFSTWDATMHAWVKAKGTFNVFVGSSSRDIRGTATIVM